ncbi:MAG: cobalamin adenosyltransferase [Synergistetes bacterium]|nr:cobalamin adenosyltransferase [Synergistota bacterium]MCX8127753.1 cobalamin adenosyltransferase [Synergistota bacterium]MDW8191331.1 cobalamin adenosyltransferase [Synergistota bacterium]
MKVLTEIELRNELRKRGPVRRFVVPPGTIITPAALSYLNENKIEIVYGEAESTEEKEPEKKKEEPKAKARFELLSAGLGVDEKPEHFTHLSGNKLVSKSHPRIKLRGKIDSLEAHIILAQTQIAKAGFPQVVSHLEEVLSIVRKILRAEVLGEPLEEFKLFGLSWSDIRDISHHPRKFIGIDHFIPSWENGEVMAYLNLIRTQIRECEIAACEAFYDEFEGVKREDILIAFNRLSSALYVMMCWLRAGRYPKGG